MPFLKQNELEK